jgi:hypothetical protein
MRPEAGLPARTSADSEIELVWGLHATVIHELLRKHVQRLPPSVPDPRLLALLIPCCLEKALAVPRPRRCGRPGAGSGLRLDIRGAHAAPRRARTPLAPSPAPRRRRPSAASPRARLITT